MSATVPFLAALDAALDMAEIRHFSALEVCQVGRSHNGVILRPAPVKLWPNIVATLHVLEQIRGNDPISIHSGYRDPAYNRAVGGVDGSQHVRFTACDISSRTRTPLQLYRALDAHPMAHTFGLGLYNGFVHLDTRGTRARWDQRTGIRPAA